MAPGQARAMRSIVSRPTRPVAPRMQIRMPGFISRDAPPHQARLGRSLLHAGRTRHQHEVHRARLLREAVEHATLRRIAGSSRRTHRRSTCAALRANEDERRSVVANDLRRLDDRTWLAGHSSQMGAPPSRGSPLDPPASETVRELPVRIVRQSTLTSGRAALDRRGGLPLTDVGHL